MKQINGMAKFKCKVCGAEQDADSAPEHCGQAMEAVEGETAEEESAEESSEETAPEQPAQ